MAKRIKYGKPRTAQEKRDAYFRQQIDMLCALMGVTSLTAIEDALGFGHNKLRRLYHNPGKLKMADADSLNRLFGMYGMRLGFDPEANGGAVNAD